MIYKAHKKVYTTVFLSDKILEAILAQGTSSAMIFTHHPTNWSIRHHGGNYAASEAYIKQLKERNISIYLLHHPLDNYGAYSTCKTLADRLELEFAEPAFSYCGALCGVIGVTRCSTVQALQEVYTKAVGHSTSLYQYGEDFIYKQRVAVCPGGGHDRFVQEEMLRKNSTILITGVTLQNEYSQKAHKNSRENGFTILGSTHYSTEKFAPMAMCQYFEQLGLPAEFIPDTPNSYDL